MVEISLMNYLLFLNASIKFTTEVESPDGCPFLNVFVYHKIDGSLGPRRPTHSDLYLNAYNHDYLAQKR